MNKGSVIIVGLGPGNENLITPEAQTAIDQATDVVGYIPYVKRIAPRDGLTLHASDNRVEIDRSIHALEMAVEGKQVVVVSSGDPGVFAMASAVFEALEEGIKDHPEWASLDIQVVPGITAMLAASAACGAPLGHDFCAINLSDNLKPFALVEHRLRHAARGDFAMGFYNPRSKSRPTQFGQVLDILREELTPDHLIIFARAVSTDEQVINIQRLGDATPDMADMRTVVLVGNSGTHVIEGTVIVNTPRSQKDWAAS
ncbi:precorrin-3B C(17)-methyltransferase [Halocynthiibacter sp.]|uniref:precorrin-3B C(17)-methyltransferase n=1 Tax=Halocynthiibacter sp. TaxID=1979210 RepID=UPI003C57D8B4